MVVVWHADVMRRDQSRPSDEAWSAWRRNSAAKKKLDPEGKPSI
jgi:hypothetical protein